MKDWKVLLVDDEKEFISTLAERLRLRGIPVRAAFDGEDAWQEIEVDVPEVIVLDIMMPGIGGLELLQRIKSQYTGIKVILLTGQGSTRDGIEGMRLGAFDYLMKPLDIEELIEKIGKAVKAV